MRQKEDRLLHPEQYTGDYNVIGVNNLGNKKRLKYRGLKRQQDSKPLQPSKSKKRKDHLMDMSEDAIKARFNRSVS